MLCGWKFKRAYIEKRTQINALLCSWRDHEIFDSPRDVHVHFTYLHINNRITIQYLIILLVLRRFTPVLLSVHLSKKDFFNFFFETFKRFVASFTPSHYLIISLSHHLTKTVTRSHPREVFMATHPQTVVIMLTRVVVAVVVVLKKIVVVVVCRRKRHLDVIFLFTLALILLSFYHNYISH